MIQIIAIGKKHESWIINGLERYQKRLRSPFDVSWVLLPHSRFEGPRARQDESERIAARLMATDYVIVLDERGHNLSSPEVSELLTEQVSHAKVTIVIGGAYGVTPALLARAQTVWSLSRLVFPHQLVRLLLIEQLYRCQEIHHHRPYHHD